MGRPKRRNPRARTRVVVRPEVKKTYNDLIGTFDQYWQAATKRSPRRKKRLRS